jgi:glyoxylase-like metal-dependent hydrolase (beta-lactamase superfamily II)
MLQQVTKGVWVHESECMQSNTTIVQGKDGVLLIDAGLTRDEMASIADDLGKLGQTVIMGFSTHPHWDHVLWDAKFGKAPRYGTSAAAAQMRAALSNPNWKDEEAADLPEEIAGKVPLDDLFGQITELPAGATYLPWDGPKVRVIEHSAHAPGHAALLVEGSKVLVAGDMLSDVFIPMLNLAAADPIQDYLAALDLFKGIADHVEFVIPGHGSVAKGDEVRGRIDQDRTYVEALRDGHEVTDPRITSPKEGWEWLAGIHGWQAQTIAKNRPNAASR